MSVNSYRGLNYDAVWGDGRVDVIIKTQSIISTVTITPQFELFDPICVELCVGHNVHMTYSTYVKLYESLYRRTKWVYNGLTIDIDDSHDQIVASICRGELVDRFVFTNEQWGKMLVPLQFVCFVNQPHVEGTEVKEKNNDE